MAAEKDFELQITVVISGFGKQRHWEQLGREVKKAIATKVGDALVSVDRVRVPGGKWYDCPIGVIPEFDYDRDV